MSQPRISVVVSTRDRRRMVHSLVRSLAEQTLPASDFEVVVVDNGSAEPVAELFAAEPPAPELNLTIARNPSPGSASSGRNFGWRLAAARYIAFTDDDCRPDPSWLRGLLSAFDAGGRVVVQGQTAPDPNDRKPGPFDHTNRVDGPNGLYETCNVAYPRDVLEQVGGFDESFRWCGEDVDLGWRAKAAGAELRYAQDAVVYHAVIPVHLRRQLRRTLQWIEAVRIMKAYPDLRMLLVHGVFWKPAHLPLIGAVAGSLIALRRRAPVILAAAWIPYLANVRRRYGAGSPGALAAARNTPRHLVVDACEVVTMTAGTIRYRTVML